MTCRNHTVHLCHWDHKFIPPFVSFIDERFDEGEHRFLIYGANCGQFTPPDNALCFSATPLDFHSLRRMRAQLRLARRIVIHGFFDNRIALLLASIPQQLEAARWVLWGGDLYDRQAHRHDCRWHVAQVMRRLVVSRIGGIATIFPGDVAHARDWLSFKGVQYPCIAYPSNVFRDLLPSAPGTQRTAVLVGNSATKSNRHLLAFDRLTATGRTDFEVICPLSYGDPSYADEVARSGHEHFGDRFTALRTFLPPEEYRFVLDRVTVAVFAHNRQQAVGNCIQLLGRGVRLHLDSTTSHSEHFRSIGFPLGDLAAINLAPLAPPEREHAHRLALETFSEERLFEQYAALCL